MFIETITVEQNLKGKYIIIVVPQQHDRECREYLSAGIYRGIYHCEQGNTKANKSKLINRMIEAAEEQIEDAQVAIKKLKQLAKEQNK